MGSMPTSIPRLKDEGENRDIYGLDPQISGPFGLYSFENVDDGEPVRWYFGSADTKGVEGFFVARDDLIESNMAGMQLRVMYTNSKRYPRIFIVQLTEKEARHTKALLENSQYIRALKYLTDNPTYEVVVRHKGSSAKEDRILNVILEENYLDEIAGDGGVLNHYSIFYDSDVDG